MRAVSTTPKLKIAIAPALVVNLEPARVDALAQNLAESLVAVLDIEAAGGLDVRRALPPADDLIESKRGVGYRLAGEPG